MIRAALQEGHSQFDSDGFRVRGLGFSRLDAFSDVVFGFAMTLLVVSLEVPHNYAELHHLLRGFLPFAVSFLLLMLVWFGHYRYFRRYGTHDAGTVWLNGLLLFVVLFYVYPLKFLFLAMFDRTIEIGTAHDLRELVVLYGLGSAAIYLLFCALYANAYRQRKVLALSPLEEKLTRISMLEEGLVGVIGLLVCVIALLLSGENAANACFAFLLIAVVKTWLGRKAGETSRVFARKEAQPVGSAPQP